VNQHLDIPPTIEYLGQFKHITGLLEKKIVLAFTIKAEVAFICGIDYQLTACRGLAPDWRLVRSFIR